MKKILLILLICFGFVFTMQAQEFVEEGFFPPDRVVDARNCSIYTYNSRAFIYCVNIYAVCYHKILENPTGDFFGIKFHYPVPNNETGEYDWVEKIIKSAVSDTTTRDWCISIGVDIKEPRTLEDDINAGNEVAVH